MSTLNQLGVNISDLTYSVVLHSSVLLMHTQLSNSFQRLSRLQKKSKWGIMIGPCRKWGCYSPACMYESKERMVRKEAIDLIRPEETN